MKTAQGEEKNGTIIVEGARENNLKSISVRIPRNAITVVTGVSGSGKSSLAFDTIYAEGNRRYVETFSAYARGFLGGVERPLVDKITGLSPVISIEQKTTSSNPRSTVGTVTEIYDFLRLLYARVSTAYAPSTGKEMTAYSDEEILNRILKEYLGEKLFLLAPVVRDRKGHYRELLETLRRKGYTYVRIDGVIQELRPGLSLARYRNHRIEVVVDKLQVRLEDVDRLKETLKTIFRLGKNQLLVWLPDKEQARYLSKNMMDEETGISFEEPAPHTFSFNSPHGACPKCKGLGVIPSIDMLRVVPDSSLTIPEGGLAPLGRCRQGLLFEQLRQILAHHNYDIREDALSTFSEELMDDLLYGSDLELEVAHEGYTRQVKYDGLSAYITEIAEAEDASAKARKWAEQFSTYATCPMCVGKRLRRDSLAFKLDGLDIAEVTDLPLPALQNWIKEVPFKVKEQKRTVAFEIVKEIESRIAFLLNVGLDYIKLNRITSSLSGGEMQRIRLATQLGSKLVNVLYILDEPSIGLHQRDNDRLIASLQALREQGNTLVVVEHDKEMMLKADYIVDMGPGAGRDGGQVIFSGTPQEMLAASTVTAQYIQGERVCQIPKKRRLGSGNNLVLKGASGNNLKGDELRIPLGTLTCITGVSGSGKSTYINDTLYPALSKHLYRSEQEPLPYVSIEGLEYIDKVVQVDQSPIGKISRSNPATYTNVFTDIRNLFVEMPESKARGYKAGRFSFNVSEGRCPACKGNGYKRIEMHFLPDVLQLCESCRGKRYKRETLEVRYKGKTIADVLDMTVNMAMEFFEFQPKILQKIKFLQDVGLGYIKLGQPSNTLSGGECQRIKLATELAKRDTGNTIYFLDEPTTGLHFEDIRLLMNIVDRLVEKGNTVVIIEHNLDVLKMADHIIDIGPEGGEKGGKVLFEGTPEEMIHCTKGYTSKYIREELKNNSQKQTKRGGRK